jgi:hypothetical protein
MTASLRCPDTFAMIGGAWSFAAGHRQLATLDGWMAPVSLQSG